MAEDGTAPAGAPQKRERKLDLRWTKKRRATFIRVLAESYDVEAACAQAGLTWPDICTLRIMFPEFELAFEGVIAAGYDRMETMLLRTAGVGGRGIDAALAQALLKQRRTGKADLLASVRQSAAEGAKAKRASRVRREQLVQSILDKVAPLRAARGSVADGGGFDAGGARGGESDAGAVGRA